MLTKTGKTAHFVYMFLCLINNIIAVANMLLGASAAITALYVDQISSQGLC